MWYIKFLNLKNIHKCNLYQKQQDIAGLVFISEDPLKVSFSIFFARQALFDWLSGLTRLSRYWSEVPKGMWHHYEAWPYHLLPRSLWARQGPESNAPYPWSGTWCIIGKLVVVLFVFLAFSAWGWLQGDTQLASVAGSTANGVQIKLFNVSCLHLRMLDYFMQELGNYKCS